MKRIQFIVFVGTSWLSFPLAMATLLFWLFVSDYWLYMWLPWLPEWTDQYLFVVFSAIIWWWLARRTERVVGRLGNPETVVPNGVGVPFVILDDKFSADAWATMLRDVARRSRLRFPLGLAPSYFRWLARSFDGQTRTSLTRIEALHSGRALRTFRFPTAGWPLVLWAFLAWCPLPSYMMEIISKKWSTPARVFVVRSEGYPGTPEVLRPAARQENGVWVRAVKRNTSAHAAQGKITIGVAPDFPRVARIVEFVCRGQSPQCSFVASLDAYDGPPEPFARKPLRAGRAIVLYNQTSLNGGQELDMQVMLLRRSREVLDTVVIH